MNKRHPTIKLWSGRRAPIANVPPDGGDRPRATFSDAEKRLASKLAIVADVPGWRATNVVHRMRGKPRFEKWSEVLCLCAGRLEPLEARDLLIETGCWD